MMIFVQVILDDINFAKVKSVSPKIKSETQNKMPNLLGENILYML